MENEFKIGDLVKLKSGSPRMIVESTELNFVSCVLWDEVNLKVKLIQNVDYAFLTKIE